MSHKFCGCPTSKSKSFKCVIPPPPCLRVRIRVFLLKCCVWFSPNMTFNIKAKQLHLSHLSIRHSSISHVVCLTQSWFRLLYRQKRFSSSQPKTENCIECFPVSNVNLQIVWKFLYDLLKNVCAAKIASLKPLPVFLCWHCINKLLNAPDQETAVCFSRGLHTCWPSVHQELMTSGTWLWLILLNHMEWVRGCLVLPTLFFLYGFIFGQLITTQWKSYMLFICCSSMGIFA